MTSRTTCMVLALLLPSGAVAGAQSTTPPSSTSQPALPSQSTQTQIAGDQAKPSEAPTGELPVNVDRIKSALDKTPGIRLTDRQLRFYVTVYAKQPRFEDLIGGFDLKNGPVPRAGMTHQEFLSMVTPKELYSTGGGITPLEVLQFSITNWAAQALIRKGLQEIRDAKNAHEIQAIRERIDRELAALMGR